MSTVGWIILAVIVVVVIVALVLVARMARGRRLAQRTEQARGLRQEALTHEPDIASSRHALTRAEAEAAVARQRAEEAEMQAQGARESLAQDQARQEDLLRQADEVDPAVDHRADDYSPTMPAPAGTRTSADTSADEGVAEGAGMDEGSTWDGDAAPRTTGGAHAGTPVDESTLPTDSRGGLHR